ncbi:hypothetical protein PybrP1_012630 [[Pythium] brassicae (nom. inval.)]|nr:hypothetical protein PybrP1_012630 [[Pythium] brassicae (nom. inval.)]
MQSGSTDKVVALARQIDPRRLLNAMSSDGFVESRESSTPAFDFETHPSARSAAPMIAHTDFERPSIRVRIQRVQLVLAALAIVAIIAVFMWFCAGDGLWLETFDSDEKDEPTRKQLLDKYNSISGNVVSVFIKPLEYFVAVVLALALLCFATEFALGSHTTRYNYVLLALAGATGYLLSNGFNAINVQLAPRPIDAVVVADDVSLSAASDTILDIDAPEKKRAKVAADLSNRTLLEESADNLITNTVFRNWALVRGHIPMSNDCKSWYGELTNFSAYYNIPGRAWSPEAMPVALKPSKQLKFVSESPSFTARVVPGSSADSRMPELPMSQTRAMTLLANAIHNTHRLFFQPTGPLGRDQLCFNLYESVRNAFARRFVNKSMEADTDFPTLTNVLLSDARATSSSAFSDADVLQVMANLSAASFTSDGDRGPTIEVELTHFDLSDNLTFDAITIEFPLQKGFLQQRLVVNASARFGYSVVTNASDSTGDQYFELDALFNCSLNACVIYGPSKKAYSQIFAYPACVDDAENDALRFRREDSGSTGEITCTNTSTTSLNVVSAGVRIEGEEISYATIGSGDKAREIVRLKNARKVVSVTLGRLSWKTVDLAALYGAECAGEDKSMCHGIRYKLAHSEGSKRRHVLVSSKQIPVFSLSGYLFNINDYAHAKGRTLVKLLVTDSSMWDDTIAAHMVLPRRFNRSGMPKRPSPKTSNCSWEVEDFLFHMEVNHLYIEKSLQPAYAAAVFFLFQDGVVRDEVDGAQTSSTGGPTSSSTERSTVTLAFLANRQLVDVRLSSPLLNIVLTLVGCGFLLLLSVAVAAASKSSEDRLERLAEAHNVVEMLVNTSKYPTLLLETTISDDVAGEREQHEDKIADDDERSSGHGSSQAEPLVQPLSKCGPSSHSSTTNAHLKAEVTAAEARLDQVAQHFSVEWKKFLAYALTVKQASAAPGNASGVAVSTTERNALEDLLLQSQSGLVMLRKMKHQRERKWREIAELYGYHETPTSTSVASNLHKSDATAAPRDVAPNSSSGDLVHVDMPSLIIRLVTLNRQHALLSRVILAKNSRLESASCERHARERTRQHERAAVTALVEATQNQHRLAHPVGLAAGHTQSPSAEARPEPATAHSLLAVRPADVEALLRFEQTKRTAALPFERLFVRMRWLCTSHRYHVRQRMLALFHQQRAKNAPVPVHTMVEKIRNLNAVTASSPTGGLLHCPLFVLSSIQLEAELSKLLKVQAEQLFDQSVKETAIHKEEHSGDTENGDGSVSALDVRDPFFFASVGSDSHWGIRQFDILNSSGSDSDSGNRVGESRQFSAESQPAHEHDDDPLLRSEWKLLQLDDREYVRARVGALARSHFERAKVDLSHSTSANTAYTSSSAGSDSIDCRAGAAASRTRPASSKENKKLLELDADGELMSSDALYALYMLRVVSCRTKRHRLLRLLNYAHYIALFRDALADEADSAADAGTGGDTGRKTIERTTTVNDAVAGKEVVLPAALHDLEIVERQMLRIASVFVNKQERASLPILNGTATALNREPDSSHVMAIDRMQVICDVYDCELGLMQVKLQLAQLLLDNGLEYTLDAQSGGPIGSLDSDASAPSSTTGAVLSVLQRRPLVDFTHAYFYESYAAETLHLELQTSLQQQIRDHFAACEQEEERLAEGGEEALFTCWLDRQIVRTDLVSRLHGHQRKLIRDAEQQWLCLRAVGELHALHQALYEQILVNWKLIVSVELAAPPAQCLELSGGSVLSSSGWQLVFPTKLVLNCCWSAQQQQQQHRPLAQSPLTVDGVSDDGRVDSVAAMAAALAVIEWHQRLGRQVYEAKLLERVYAFQYNFARESHASDAATRFFFDDTASNDSSSSSVSPSARRSGLVPVVLELIGEKDFVHLTTGSAAGSSKTVPEWLDAQLLSLLSDADQDTRSSGNGGDAAAPFANSQWQALFLDFQRRWTRFLGAAVRYQDLIGSEIFEFASSLPFLFLEGSSDTNAHSLLSAKAIQGRYAEEIAEKMKDEIQQNCYPYWSSLERLKEQREESELEEGPGSVAALMQRQQFAQRFAACAQYLRAEAAVPEHLVRVDRFLRRLRDEGALMQTLGPSTAFACAFTPSHVSEEHDSCKKSTLTRWLTAKLQQLRHDLHSGYDASRGASVGPSTARAGVGEADSAGLCGNDVDEDGGRGDGAGKAEGDSCLLLSLPSHLYLIDQFAVPLCREQPAGLLLSNAQALTNDERAETLRLLGSVLEAFHAGMDVLRARSALLLHGLLEQWQMRFHDEVRGFHDRIREALQPSVAACNVYARSNADKVKLANRSQREALQAIRGCVLEAEAALAASLQCTVSFLLLQSRVSERCTIVALSSVLPAASGTASAPDSAISAFWDEMREVERDELRCGAKQSAWVLTAAPHELEASAISALDRQWDRYELIAGEEELSSTRGEPERWQPMECPAEYRLEFLRLCFELQWLQSDIAKMEHHYEAFLDQKARSQRGSATARVSHHSQYQQHWTAAPAAPPLLALAKFYHPGRDDAFEKLSAPEGAPDTQLRDAFVVPASEMSLLLQDLSAECARHLATQTDTYERAIASLQTQLTAAHASLGAAQERAARDARQERIKREAFAIDHAYGLRLRMEQLRKAVAAIESRTDLERLELESQLSDAFSAKLAAMHAQLLAKQQRFDAFRVTMQHDLHAQLHGAQAQLVHQLVDHSGAVAVETKAACLAGLRAQHASEHIAAENVALKQTLLKLQALFEAQRQNQSAGRERELALLRRHTAAGALARDEAAQLQQQVRQLEADLARASQDKTHFMLKWSSLHKQTALAAQKKREAKIRALSAPYRRATAAYCAPLPAVEIDALAPQQPLAVAMGVAERAPQRKSCEDDEEDAFERRHEVAIQQPALPASAERERESAREDSSERRFFQSSARHFQNEIRRLQQQLAKESKAKAALMEQVTQLRACASPPPQRSDADATDQVHECDADDGSATAAPQRSSGLAPREMAPGSGGRTARFGRVLTAPASNPHSRAQSASVGTPTRPPPSSGPGGVGAARTRPSTSSYSPRSVALPPSASATPMTRRFEVQKRSDASVGGVAGVPNVLSEREPLLYR